MIACTECGRCGVEAEEGKSIGRCEGEAITQSAVSRIGGTGEGSTEMSTPSEGVLPSNSVSVSEIVDPRSSGLRTRGNIGRPRICPPPHTAHTLHQHQLRTVNRNEMRRLTARIHRPSPLLHHNDPSRKEKVHTVLSSEEMISNVVMLGERDLYSSSVCEEAGGEVKTDLGRMCRALERKRGGGRLWG